MKNLILAASAALVILSGCAKNEIMDGGATALNDGKVRFAGTTNRNTRAADGNPVNNGGLLQETVKEFTVTAYANANASASTGSVELLKDKAVSWTGGSWEYANEPYWPTTKVDFYAHANWPTNGAPTVSATEFKATDVVIGQDKLAADGQKDLLVAATLQQSKPSGNAASRVTLSFKHALTQIAFAVKNVDSELKVRIGALRVVNVNEKGTMTYTTGTQGITWSSSDIVNGGYFLQGLQSATANDFTTAPAASDAFTAGNTFSTLKLAAHTTKSNSLLLIPQTFAAWVPSTATTGAYIEMLAIINKSTATSTDQAIGDAAFYYCGTPIQGADGKADTYGIIRIPIESVSGDLTEWTANKKITYQITFGERESGSGGGGYEPGGDPVLVPIRFKAEVGDWTEVEVPLLTAKLESNASTITSTLINGLNNQLFLDIKNAKDVKTYKAKISLTGTATVTLSEDIVIATTALANAEAKMAIGTTVEYDFTTIDTYNSKTIKMTVPTGWKAETYKETNKVADVAASSEFTIEGSTANKFILTKITVTP